MSKFNRINVEVDDPKILLNINTEEDYKNIIDQKINTSYRLTNLWIEVTNLPKIYEVSTTCEVMLVAAWLAGVIAFSPERMNVARSPEVYGFKRWMYSADTVIPVVFT